MPRPRETRLLDAARALAGKRGRALVVGAAASVAFAASAPAAASPQDVFGYGPRSTAMAGAGASIGWGFETVRANPSRP